MKIKKGWKRVEPNKYVYEYSVCFYQKRIKEDLFVNIVEYSHCGRPITPVWEVRIQIHEDDSITGKTINIIIFTYEKLDFDKMEKDARKVIKRLV